MLPILLEQRDREARYWTAANCSSGSMRTTRTREARDTRHRGRPSAAVLERLFVSDLTCTGATQSRPETRLVELMHSSCRTPSSGSRRPPPSVSTHPPWKQESPDSSPTLDRRPGSPSLPNRPIGDRSPRNSCPTSARHRRLCRAFSDTEVRTEIARAAYVCEVSGYSVNELRTIWFRELSPLLSTNLLSPAGEWAGLISSVRAEYCRETHHLRCAMSV